MRYPRYDWITREIKDATPGTFTYRHEERHKEQHEKDWLSMCFALSYVFSAFFIILSWFLGIKMIVIAAMVPTILMIILEFDAHYWAWKRRKRLS